MTKTVYVVQRSPESTDGERRWLDAATYTTKAEARNYIKRIRPLFSVSKFRIVKCVTTKEVVGMSDKPQVPEKAGEWWARLDLEDGEIHFGKTTLLPTGVIWWEACGRGCTIDPESGDQWHRIELPKGWE